MASYGFGSISLEEAVAFLKELSRGAWEKDDISALVTKQSVDLIEAPGLFLFLKIDINQAITTASQLAGSDLSVLLKKGDSVFDNLQARLEARLKLTRLEGDEETQRAVDRCEEKLVIPGIRGMSYSDEITNARLQIKLATQEAPAGERALREDVALVGLTGFFVDLEKEVDAFEALYRQSELPPSIRIQTALRESARALNHAYEALQRLELYTTPHSALAQDLEQRRAPFEALLESTAARAASIARANAARAAASKPTTPPTTTEPGKD